MALYILVKQDISLLSASILWTRQNSATVTQPSAVCYTGREHSALIRLFCFCLFFKSQIMAPFWLQVLPFYASSSCTRKPVHHTSWKSCDISHTRQEFDCISHLCLSERKKSRSSGVCVRAWTIQFMKHVLPRFINPRKPAGQEEETKRKCENNTGKKRIKHDVIYTTGNGGNLNHH